MSDKWYVIFYMSKMVIVWQRLLRKFLITTSISQRLTLEAATDRRSVKIGILKSISDSLKNTCERVFLVKLLAIALKFY